MPLGAEHPTHDAANLGFVEEVEIQGHIIDSLLLPKVLDEILTHGGSYVIKDIRIGQRQEDTSMPSSRCAPTAPRSCATSSTPFTITVPSPPTTAIVPSSSPT